MGQLLQKFRPEEISLCAEDPHTPSQAKDDKGHHELIDPRSPTVGISRTPLEVENTPKRITSVDSPTSFTKKTTSKSRSLHQRVLERRVDITP
ncbi:hypothetical protein AB6A40_005311 [Gnathostoma spinigerum]|uniref:Uncharacterized protein n=1 Tax=Gnathostoma spinigerum TaxID=75299 RepID=A0ABD6EPJ9_9BILA